MTRIVCSVQSLRRETSSADESAYRRIGLYVVLMGMVAVLSSIQVAVLARMMPPEALGYYAVVATIASYGLVLQFGLLSGLGQVLPVTLGAGRHEDAARLVGTTTRLLAAATSVAVLLFAGAVWYASDVDSHVRVALLLGGIVAAADQFFQLVVLRLRSERRVVAFPVVLAVQKFALLLIGAAAAAKFGYVGMVITWIAADLGIWAYITHRHLSPASYSGLRWPDIRTLVTAGLPVVGAGLCDNVRLSLDRIFLLNATSSHALGIYQLGAVPVAVGLVLTGVINQYVSPQLLFEYGHKRCLATVFKKSTLLAGAVGFALLLVAWPALAVASAIVTRWLPRYRESIPLFSVFYLGMACIVATGSVSVTTTAARRQMLQFSASAIAAACSLVGFSVLKVRGEGIWWYAAVSTGGMVAHSIGQVAFSYHCVRQHQARPVFHASTEVTLEPTV